MIEKTLLDSHGREVTIKVSDDHIVFYFADVVRHQKQWVEEQLEIGNEVSDEEKEAGEFYWIDKDIWIKDFSERLDREDNFHKHMKRKRWVTKEMYDFMNAACSL